MSLGSQLHNVLREFHAALPEDSELRLDVDKDETHLRRMGVDGVSILDDAAFQILTRLYSGSGGTDIIVFGEEGKGQEQATVRKREARK